VPADPTDADHDRAVAALIGPSETRIDRIAQALADEREQAVAPFLALADNLDAVADDYRHAAPGSHDAGARNAHYAIAAHIRRTAQEDPK
jgi:hypothetical protein